MTPLEAADRVEQSPDYDPGDCVRVLVDHARATSPAPEGGDLADAADALAAAIDTYLGEESTLTDAVRDYPDDGAVWAAVSDLHGLRDRVRDALDAAPAPSVATPPQEGGSVRVRALLAGLEELDAKWPGHVRTLIGPELADRLLAALAPPADDETTAGVGMLHAAIGDLGAILDHVAPGRGLTAVDAERIRRRARLGRKRIEVAIRDAPEVVESEAGPRENDTPVTWRVEVSGLAGRGSEIVAEVGIPERRGYRWEPLGEFLARLDLRVLDLPTSKETP